MWNICKNYSCYDFTPCETPPEDLPLDTVEVAGNARLAHLLERAKLLGIAFAVLALEFVMLPAKFLEMAKPPRVVDPGRALACSAKWAPHLCALRDLPHRRPSHVLAELIDISRVLFVHTYFAVIKSDLITARAIVNGRRFSELCAAPPRVNLPDLAWILRLLARTFGGGTIFMCGGDIRHWFHQITWHPEIARYYLLLLEPAGRLGINKHETKDMMFTL